MESDFIRWLGGHLPESPELRVGVGDDAAVLKTASSADRVMTADLLADGVHFLLGRDGPHAVGRKALAVNLSDIAAMAARPVAAVTTVVLPKNGGGELARELIQGMLPLAEKYNVALAGGDTNTWDGPLVISVTLLGEATEKGPLLRSGARPGDSLVVTGSFGGSSLGHHLNFEPRIDEARLLFNQYTLHGGMDCSDGLSLDASRLAEQSRCGLELDTAAIPISDAACQLAADDSMSDAALHHALKDGEDFELLLAIPADDADRLLSDQPLDIPVTRIGQFVDESGLWRRVEGQRESMEPQGYEH